MHYTHYLHGVWDLELFKNNCNLPWIGATCLNGVSKLLINISTEESHNGRKG